jgi:hypothetical protein
LQHPTCMAPTPYGSFFFAQNTHPFAPCKRYSNGNFVMGGTLQ